MSNNIQTAGYVTGFRVGEMILEDSRKVPIIELEYRPHPASPDEECMSVQLAFRSEVANRMLQELKRKIDEIAHGVASLN